jgi:adenine-specific DNA-methyltransferase
MKLVATANPRERQEELGQFLTASPVADFMASMFGPLPRTVRLLDAGAGAGSLTAAFVSRCCEKRDGIRVIEATLYELDCEILDALSATMRECERRCVAAGIRFTFTIHSADFIHEMSTRLAGDLFGSLPPAFDAAIANPPYRKISTDSTERRALRAAGVETSNLYTGFIALIQRLLVPGGQLVGITPRSFCNGPYFRPFREDFLSQLELRRLHVFESRQAAFRDDSVLQENIIFHAVKGRNQPDEIVISSSSGEHGGDITESVFPFSEIVYPHDPEKFIHIPSAASHVTAKETLDGLSTSLASLGVTVSTGRVVDFRLKDALRKEPERGTVPLLYPCHFNGGNVHWPRLEARKPNAILDNAETRPWLVPSGVYLLTKRFTSKEERRRLVACMSISKRDAPRRVDAACFGENFVKLQLKVGTRNRVHKDESKLRFQALRDEHFSSSETKEIATEVRRNVLFRGLNFANQNLAQIGLNFFQRIQVNGFRKTHHVKRLSVNNHVPLGEGNDQIFLLFCRRNQITESLARQKQSRFSRRRTPRVGGSHAAPPCFVARSRVSNFFTNSDSVMPSEAHTARTSTISSRRSPVSYLLTKLCGIPNVSDSWTWVKPLSVRTSRRRARKTAYSVLKVDFDTCRVSIRS